MGLDNRWYRSGSVDALMGMNGFRAIQIRRQVLHSKQAKAINGIVNRFLSPISVSLVPTSTTMKSQCTIVGVGAETLPVFYITTDVFYQDGSYQSHACPPGSHYRIHTYQLTLAANFQTWAIEPPLLSPPPGFFFFLPTYLNCMFLLRSKESIRHNEPPVLSPPPLYTNSTPRTGLKIKIHKIQ